MIALIDGDELAYRISSTYQKNYYGVYRDDKLLWRCRTREDAIESVENTDDLEIKIIVEVYNPNGFERKVTDSLIDILTNAECREYHICLSGESNFRYSLARLKPYKGNREGGEKPGHYLLIKDYLSKLGAEKVDYLEADDLMAYHGNNGYNKYVICSSDKDLLTVPSNNYNLLKRNKRHVSLSDAIYRFYTQLLIGDDTDNIPHPYNLGVITASKILDDLYGSINEWDYYQRVLENYHNFLELKDKYGVYKTSWYNDSLVLEEILWEVGNLIYMHRTLDPNERWNAPINKEA